MATDVERLVVSLEARIDKYTKALQKASGTADTQARKIEKRFDAMSSKLAGAGKSAMLALAGGFAGGLAAGGIEAVVRGIGDVISSMSQLKAEAATAGLPVETFQELKFAADKAKIGTDAFVDGLKELSLRSDEFATTGKGSAAEAFQRLGFSAKDAGERMKDPAAFLEEIIERTRRLGDTAAAIRIFDELFGGTGGEEFVRFLDDGLGSISDMRQAARDAGAVIDADLVRKAADVDRAFAQVADTIGFTVKSAIVEAVAATGDWAAAIGEVARQLGGLPNFAGAFGSTTNGGTGGGWAGLPNFAQAAGGGGLGTGKGDLGGAAMVTDTAAKVANAAVVAQLKAKLESGDYGGGMFGLSDITAKAIPSTSTPKRGGGGGGGRDKAAGEAKRQAEAVRDVIEALHEELSLVGATDEQQRIAAETRRAGAAATEEQKAKIAELVTQIEAERDRVDELNASMEALNDLGRDVLGGFIQDLKAGKSGAEALAGALDKVADKLLNSALDGLFGGGGSGGGFLSGLLGAFFKPASPFPSGIPLYSSGGYTGSGGKYKPAGVVHAGEFVINKDATRRNRALLEALNAGLPGYAAGGAVGIVKPASVMSRASVTGAEPTPFNLTVDVRGANGDREIERRIQAGVTNGIRQYDAALPSRMRSKQTRSQLR